MNSLLKKKEKKTWNDIYDRGDNSNASDLDNHDIYSSENDFNSIEDFEGVDDEPKKSNEAFNFFNAKQKLLKTFIYKEW